MKRVRSSLRFVSVAVFGGILAVAVAAGAADNDPNFSGAVNCGDSNTNGACIECCSGAPGCTIGKISCCPLVGECTVTNKPTGGTVLKLKEAVGGLTLQFDRKGADDSFDVKLKAKFLKKVFRKGIVLKAKLAGSDAKLAGLVFPVLFLANGDGAAGQLQSGGYDVTISGTMPTCQSLYPAQLCSELAVSLSRSIYGALAAGDRIEAQQFLDAV
ncbi:MAG: hypothetical protein ABIR79_25600, partial [Candidatus Binatia bacterium]